MAREDLPILILFDGWMSFFRDRVVPWRIGMAEKTRTQLEVEVLPRYAEAQRWFAHKGEPLKALLGVACGMLRDDGHQVDAVQAKACNVEEPTAGGRNPEG